MVNAGFVGCGVGLVEWLGGRERWGRTGVAGVVAMFGSVGVEVALCLEGEGEGVLVLVFG